MSLGLHLEFLLSQDVPEDYRAQGRMEHLTKGYKMTEDLLLKLSAGEGDTSSNERDLKLEDGYFSKIEGIRR